MLLFAKMLAAPLLILLLTLAGRRFGPAASGLLMGIPLITGPVSFFSAVEQGTGYAAHAATGNLVGQVSTCLFCFAYALAAMRGAGAFVSAAAGIAAFAVGTVVWNQATWSLGPAALLLLATIAAMPRLMPRHAAAPAGKPMPRWDLPLRMAVSTAMVLGLTMLAGRIGPQLSGLIAPFPTFVLILAVFTHLEAGGAASASLARGVVTGSVSFAAFFICVGAGIERAGLWIYAPAALASMAAGAIAFALRRRSDAVTGW